MRVSLIKKDWFGGFTLIELLIVIGIILILLAIAIPNFLAAQTRALVTRARSDLRSVSIALEGYQVDYHAYPLMTVPGFAGGPPAIAGSELMWWYVPNVLSTPIPYLADANLQCPFGGNWDKADFFPEEIWKRYGYENIGEMIIKAKTFPVFQRRYPPHAISWSGPWRLQCVGPDRLWNPSVLYNPSNGLTSRGDMIVTQKSANGNVNFNDGGF